MKNNTFEYKMSPVLVNTYLKMRKGKEKTGDIQEYLCRVVNEEFGLKGICTKVLTF